MGIMKRTLELLFPRGYLWRFIGDSAKLIEGLALSLDRAKDLIDQARRESIPSTAFYTIPEWYEMLGMKYDETLPLEKHRTILSAMDTAENTCSLDGLATQIAKEYPGLVIEENSGSEFPDDPAGRTYWQDDWATTDGWTAQNCTLSVGSGVIKLTSTTTSGNISIGGRGSVLASKLFIARVRTNRTLNVKLEYTTSIPSYPGNTVMCLAGQWTNIAVFPGTDAVANTAKIIMIGATSITDTLEVDTIYIGDGSYLPHRYSITGVVDTELDALRVGAILARVAPLHLVPTVFGYTAATAGNPNPVPPSPGDASGSILNMTDIPICGVATCGVTTCGVSA